jgi:NDP-4-keto-2,6-dideoxyhexose 3-C-methyltransferase
MYKAIDKCRVCGNRRLVTVLNLGKQALTGVFPRSKTEVVEKAPLELVKCHGVSVKRSCGLVQLKHSFDFHKIYSETYGYRSGLNRTMVEHLKKIAKKATSYARLRNGDIIIDIGSNDATLLKSYPQGRFRLIGIDPLADKFKQYYTDNIEVIDGFFPTGLIKNSLRRQKAKIVTSIAVFYDLKNPLHFAKEIANILDDDGIWFCEQSYLPTMISNNSYDTICHEHLEYYALRQIKWILDMAELKIIDIGLNDINGGSFYFTAAKAGSRYKEASSFIGRFLKKEKTRGIDKLKTYKDFKRRVFEHRSKMQRLVKDIKAKGKILAGLGASTKGNVILQFCGFSQREVSFIGDVNKDKFGSYTPGSLIPIISEKEAFKLNPDYILILPWHLKGMLNKKAKYILPLPEVKII